MPWCPKCKMEYREGFTTCSECHVDLVPSLEDIPEEYRDDAKTDPDDPVIYPKGWDEEPLPASEFLGEEPERRMSAGYYRPSAQQAEENRSSGWILLVVGGLGIVVVILGILGILPFRMGSPYLFYGVLSAVFLLFLVMGIISLRQSVVFQKKAKSEHTLEESLLQWTKENLTAEKIDSYLPEDERRQGEHLYFQRSEIIFGLLNKQFMNLDPGMVERLIDEKIYDELFPRKDD